MNFKLFILLIFVSCSISNAEAKIELKNKSEWVKSNDGKLSLRISAEKVEHKPTTNVIIKIELKNNTKNKIRISNTVYTMPACGNGIKITGINGELMYQGPQKSVFAYPQEIKGGDVLTEIVILRNDNWKGFTNKGKYVIQYTFISSSDNQNKDLWNGSIISKKLTIEKK